MTTNPTQSDLLVDVLNCPSLPSLPAVAVRLLELTSDPEVDLSDIAKLVQQDQALSAKVLKTVNSSFYGLSTPCGSIERAMGYLGLNTVKSLVLGFSLVETTKQSGGDGFDLNAHWRRAIIGATGARTMARFVGGIDPEEAFTAALFQDMGMLANYTAMKTRYTQVIDGVPHRSLCRSEFEAFGFTHTQVGAELANKWKLPDEIVESIRVHHEVTNVKPTHEAMAKVVSLGALLTDAMDDTGAKAAVRNIERATREWYAKKAPNVQAVLEEVAETSSVLAKMFDQDIGSLPSASEIMDIAQERTIEHQVSIQRQSEELERSAYIDGLTGIANRKRFDQELDAAFKQYQSSGQHFGLLFFDADKFKSVNDTYGHAAGDAVLVELAKRTSDTIGDAGFVCRYGGEEFAVILPNANLDEAAMLAEQVRCIIAGTPFDLRGVDGAPDELSVTVSIGVSTICAGDPARLTTADRIVHEADECVYAAKNAGRNNVQVFGRIQETAPKQETSDAVQSDPRPAEPTAKVQEKSSPARQAPTQQQPSSAKTSETGDSLDSGASGRILLVEDDALAATLVISLIRRRNKGIDIQWVKSGSKACLLLESGGLMGDKAVNLVICDLNLPGCSGHEVLKVFKSTPSVSHIPFFMLTGTTDLDMRDESHRLGASMYILKDDFCADVNKWIGEVMRPFSLAA